ncbi:potassium channel family protein [Streptococcus troglodytae]|uniref:Trk system potassium uptake protein TrkA n=1 Tax=Streptococcus troglodytae TaxID=1111760 RepID=A0A1L7LI54_9STRE|nr:NAD-binding protein [Streptococcus troglodytae]BAQ23819.1 potassium uptake system protein TrkB [Streptococcus troglodytae]
MKIIIIGCGKVGTHVARQLLDSHHQVTIIERDQKRFEQVLQIFSQAEVLHGDGTSPILLEKCSVETANAVAYLTGKDEINLVGSTVAKFNYAVDRVVARVNNPKNEWLFNADMGVDSRVSQASLLASVIINEVNIESTATLLKLNDDENAIVEFVLSKGASVHGKTIKEINFPNDAVLISIHRQGQNIIPKGETVLLEGDYILAYTNSQNQEKLAQLFR